jgi:hypothetical protein
MGHLPAVQVLLDGQPVALPGKVLAKLSAVRAQLEQLALRKDRILTALWVDGIAVNLQQSSVEWRRFQRVEAQTVSFVELGASMIATVRREARETAARIRLAGSQVLINPWPEAYRLVRRLEAETRTLLLVIGFIDELCSDSAGLSHADVRTIRDHIDCIDELQQRLHAVATDRSVEGLSDFLFLAMAPWVERLAELLQSQHE